MDDTALAHANADLLRTLPDEGPVVMVNLVKLRAQSRDDLRDIGVPLRQGLVEALPAPERRGKNSQWIKRIGDPASDSRVLCSPALSGGQLLARSTGKRAR